MMYEVKETCQYMNDYTILTRFITYYLLLKLNNFSYVSRCLRLTTWRPLDHTGHQPHFHYYQISSSVAVSSFHWAAIMIFLKNFQLN